MCSHLLLLPPRHVLLRTQRPEVYEIVCCS
uniref:Uncharacterized protein n=1 Tax=Aegilops tauschii subsp. strangulata TaxID=200361 RepID=A0A453B929_AEGTS